MVTIDFDVLWYLKILSLACHGRQSRSFRYHTPVNITFYYDWGTTDKQLETTNTSKKKTTTMTKTKLTSKG